MTDLADFLLARIAEDEEGARSATPGSWLVDSEDPERVTHDDGNDVDYVADAYALSGRQARANAAHIARHHPARVLAECAAKRRIVQAEARWRRTKENVTASTHKMPDPSVDVTWFDEDYRPHQERVTEEEFTERFTEPSPPSDTLRLLALPHADHPDWREEWRP